MQFKRLAVLAASLALLLSFAIPQASGQGLGLEGTLIGIRLDISRLATKLGQVETALDMRDGRPDKLYGIQERVKELERKTERFDPSMAALERDTLNMRIGTMESQIEDVGDVGAIRSELHDLRRDSELSYQVQKQEIQDLRYEIEVLKGRATKK
jgi:hypothetical protein